MSKTKTVSHYRKNYNAVLQELCEWGPSKDMTQFITCDPTILVPVWCCQQKHQMDDVWQRFNEHVYAQRLLACCEEYYGRVKCLPPNTNTLLRCRGRHYQHKFHGDNNDYDFRYGIKWKRQNTTLENAKEYAYGRNLWNLSARVQKLEKTNRQLSKLVEHLYVQLLYKPGGTMFQSLQTQFHEKQKKHVHS